MNNKYKRILIDEQKDNDFWPSFTDMLTTILLVVLLIFMVITQNKLTSLAEAENQVKESQKEIEQQQEVIKSLIGVKQDIIESLLLEFENTDIAIEIDEETGAIKFQDDLLFETNKSNIRPEFKQKLQDFIPRYFEILFGKYNNEIAEVVVEGHTDDRGSFKDNLVLSQERAFSVVTHILGNEFGDLPYIGDVKDKITANGRSESVLKKDENGKVNREKSRRVEFKFRLKNESNLEYILNSLNEAEPNNAKNTAN